MIWIVNVALGLIILGFQIMIIRDMRVVRHNLMIIRMMLEERRGVREPGGGVIR